MKTSTIDLEANAEEPIEGGPITREKVYARTRGLAWLAGRREHEIHQVDYERAKRELTGETQLDRQNAVLDGKPVHKNVSVGLAINSNGYVAKLGQP